jgi:hypothetical protein
MLICTLLSLVEEKKVDLTLNQLNVTLSRVERGSVGSVTLNTSSRPVVTHVGTQLNYTLKVTWEFRSLPYLAVFKC